MSKLLSALVFLAYGLPVHAGAPVGGAMVKATAPRPAASAASAAKAAPGKPDAAKADEKKDAPRK